MKAIIISLAACLVGIGGVAAQADRLDLYYNAQGSTPMTGPFEFTPRQCISSPDQALGIKNPTIGKSFGIRVHGDDVDYCVYVHQDPGCLGKTRAIAVSTHADTFWDIPEDMSRSMRITKGGSKSAMLV